MKRVYYYISLFIIVALTFSCNRKWKETTRVDFHFNITQSHSTDYLQITSGSISINNFEFSGDRKKGGGVSFYDDLSNGADLNFNNGKASTYFYYDIPQGTYSRISLTMKSNNIQHSDNITLKGVFIDSIGGDTIPVIFNMNVDDVFSIDSKAGDGGSDISLVKGSPTSCDITFNAKFWFANVTKSMLQNADRYNIGGVETIDIKEYKNGLIYETALPRISQENTAVFK